MMSESAKQYTVLAAYYDRLNESVDYKEWSAFIKLCIEKYGLKDSELVLDLACGTGSMSIELSKLGYDVIGIDKSVDMLMEARQRADESNVNLLLLNQDMRSFELYGTVDAAVCCLDSINYLTRTSDLKQCFKTVHNYLNPDGLFIFDVNTPHKFKDIYGNNDYVFELEDNSVFCAWHNEFNPETYICDFFLTFFVKCKDGKYERYEERQQERMFSFNSISKALNESDFELLGVFSDLNFTEYSSNDERWHWICRAKKI